MKPLLDFPDFQAHVTTLKETSACMENEDEESEESKKASRDCAQHLIYMTENETPVINFDAVKDAIRAETQITRSPCSVDALAYWDDGLALIEFKNIDMYSKDKKGRKKAHLEEKISDSLLLFLRTTDETISFVQKHVVFIVVYNEEKNLPKSKRGREASLEKTKERWAKKADVQRLRFGVGDYKTLYFKDAYTLTEKQFEEALKTHTLSLKLPAPEEASPPESQA